MAELDNLKKDDQLQLIETDTQELTTFWANRNSQMLEDRKVVHLIKNEKEKTDKTRWWTNEPKVFFDTARAMVSLTPPKFRLPIPINFSPEEKQKMNKAERLCLGIWRQLNRKAGRMGNTSWLYDFAYWILLGHYAYYSGIEKGQDGIEFVADILDPMTVYPKWDKDGLVKVVRAYETDKITAEGMAWDFQQKGLKFEYEDPKEGQKPKVVNYWVRDGKKIYNAITINGVLAKELTHHTKLREIPIHYGMVGMPDKMTDNWIMRQGEAIIAADVDMIQYTNTMLSLRATIMAETAYPNIVTKTRTGMAPIKPEDIKGYGSNIPLKLADSIELLKHATTPQDVDMLMQYINGQMQKGAFPNVVYGGLSVETSGFAINQLMNAIKYRLGPYTNAVNFAISTLMSDFLYLFRTGNSGSITLSTEDPYSLKRGLSFIEEFKPEDVPERIYVEVDIPLQNQFDKTQAILNAVQAIQSGVLSRETAWETMLDIQDTDQEKQRIQDDMVSNDPFVMGIEIIERMWERVEYYTAMKMYPQAEALKRYIMIKEMEMGMRQGIPEVPGAPGVPSSQSPPEARRSPDVGRAMLGVGPPGLSRRPQTQEERAASKASPRLVSSSGEALL
ncbi:MAG: hypothetical protein PHQ43_08130 [Dehalococcoidales bacterium]|nr:hypothetical protein [Dehalococcoidales bacterium]